MEMRDGEIGGFTDTDREIIGKAVTIGDTPAEQLAGVIAIKSVESLSSPVDISLAITGLYRAAQEFNFAGHDRAGNMIAAELGIPTQTALSYLADLALLGNGLPAQFTVK